MKKITLLLTIPLLSLTSCDEKQEAKSHVPRYDVQTFSVMGMALICQITDNEENKTYMYDMKGKSMKLKTIIDLSKVGDQTIPMDEIGKED